jgi:hypothetical protein
MIDQQLSSIAYLIYKIYLDPRGDYYFLIF